MKWPWSKPEPAAFDIQEARRDLWIGACKDHFNYHRDGRHAVQEADEVLRGFDANFSPCQFDRAAASAPREDA